MPGYKRIQIGLILSLMLGTLVFFLSCSDVPLPMSPFGNRPKVGANSAPPHTKEPGLEDLFSGQAVFRSIKDSEEVKFAFSQGSVLEVNDQKVAIFKNSADGRYFALTRGHVALAAGRSTYKIFLFASSSNDALNFDIQIGSLFPDLDSSKWTLYDPHIAVNDAAVPTRYILTMECGLYGAFGPSVCISESTAPWDLRSWSEPKLIVESNLFKSGSTGAVLVDQGALYVKWTLVDDGNNWFESNGVTSRDEGFESTITKAAALESPQTNLGNATSAGQILIGAERNVRCTSSWDCNNVDVQDWKKFGSFYYAIYNGANYYRCVRPEADRNTLTSKWGLAIRRSLSPLGNYNESTGPILMAERDDTCGISYPVINVLNGSVYMYYAYYPKTGGNRTMRSKLEWKNALAVQPIPPPATPTHEAETDQTERLNQVITHYYSDLLGRAPNPAEVNSWITDVLANSMSAKKLAEGFLYSTEFQSRWGSLTRNERIEVLYRGLLWRDPDSVGSATIGQLIDSNQPFATVVSIILDSTEFAATSSK